MNVNLTPDLEEMVHNKVKTGRYNSASDVVRDALRLMEDRDQIKELHRGEIQNKIDAGLASLTAGQGIDGEEFMAKMLSEIEAEIDGTSQRALTQ